ncbi:hypothetical protein EVAR_17676_1 [Eumeta japonica]|uniref:Uncharacterized protein n=1 Tax=Eumeta variegata TaxID=151549 RepID=A0A4C1URQ7_EUMVA|nr:hypothetical protein EVAR_17676_1 [Eumeta japonica]
MFKKYSCPEVISAYVAQKNQKCTGYSDLCLLEKDRAKVIPEHAGQIIGVFTKVTASGVRNPMRLREAIGNPLINRTYKRNTAITPAALQRRVTHAPPGVRACDLMSADKAAARDHPCSG